MSHNGRYYTKKLKQTDSKGCEKLSSFFKPVSNAEVVPELTISVNETVVDGVVDIDEQCKNHCENDDNEKLDDTTNLPQSSTDQNECEEPEDEPILSKSALSNDAREFSHHKYELRFPWLYYSYCKGGFCCKLCEHFNPIQDNGQLHAFVSGVQLGTHPTRKLLKHDASKHHRSSEQKKVIHKQSVVDMLHAQKENQETHVKNINRKYLSSLIRTIIFVVKKRWALDSVSDLIEHVRTLRGEDIVTYMEQHKPEMVVKYTSSSSVTELLDCISHHYEEILLNALRKAECFSLLADESSDDAHREQFAILARFRYEGTVSDFFLGLVEVPRTDAASIMTVIEGFLIAKNLDMKKVLFVGFDGCNTMSGENKGLQRRFRHHVPHQVYINCRNHRLALCIKHLIKQYPVIATVDGFMLGIWKLFHYSPKKFALFCHIQETYGIKKYNLIRAAATRWLSHGRACKRLVDRYVQVIDTLDASLSERYDPEVFGVREQLLCKNSMAMVLILCDLLAPVIRFSDFLQGNHALCDVTVKTKDLIAELGHLENRMRAKDPDLYMAKLTEIFLEIDDRQFGKAFESTQCPD